MYQTAGVEAASPILNIHDELNTKLSPEQIKLLEDYNFPITALKSQDAFAGFAQDVIHKERDTSKQVELIIEFGEIERNLFRKSIPQIIDEMGDKIYQSFKPVEQVCNDNYIDFLLQKHRATIENANSARATLIAVSDFFIELIRTGKHISQSHGDEIMEIIQKKVSQWKDFPDKAIYIESEEIRALGTISGTHALLFFDSKIVYKPQFLSEFITLSKETNGYKIERKNIS